MSLAWVVFWCLGWLASDTAQAEILTCAVCGKSPLSGKIWVQKKPAITNYICFECHDLPLHCSVCQLPVKDGYTKTTDGRIICKRDFPNVVLRQEEGEQIFEDTRTEVRRIAGYALDLQSARVEVRLFDIDYWNSTSGERSADGMHRIGFSHSRRAPDGFTHNVILLSGQRKEQVATTCAHEYMHLWINENRPRNREIEADTSEGICELLAFKLAQARKSDELQAQIKENPYTHGRILTLISVESRIGLTPILDWVKAGNKATLDEDFAGYTVTAAPFDIQSLPKYTNAAPDRLVLKGIMKSGGKRSAIINGHLFGKDDEDTIKLGEKSVRIRCVEVQSDAVIIRIDDSAETTRLKLD